MKINSFVKSKKKKLSVIKPLSWTPRQNLCPVLNKSSPKRTGTEEVPELYLAVLPVLTELLFPHLTVLLPRVPKINIQDKSQISFCKILKYK